MTREDMELLDELLYGSKSALEIVGRLHIGHMVAHTTNNLRRSRSVERRTCEGERNIEQRRIYICAQHGRYNASDIAHRASSTDDDRTWGDDACTIGIFLYHRKRVFTRRYVDAQRYAEIGERFHGLVQTCVLTLLSAARPHPVGTERHVVQSTVEWSKH